MRPGAGPGHGGRRRGGSGGAETRRQGCPRCAPPCPGLPVPRTPTEVRLVAVGVGWGAPGRGSVGVVGHGHSGVVGVPRVRVGQEGGCCMVVVAAGERLWLIAVRAATPRRRAVAAMAWAAAAGRGPVRAAGAVPALIFGVWFSVRSRRCRKVHLIVRVPWTALLPAASPMSLPGRTVSVSVRVRHPGRKRLFLRFGPRHSPATSRVLPRQSHAALVLCWSDSDDCELGCMVQLFFSNGGKACTKFIPKDTTEESCINFTGRRIVDFLPADPQGFRVDLRIDFLGCIPLLFRCALCLVGGCSF